MTNVQQENGFLAVGGFDQVSESYLNTIFRFDQSTYEWVMKGERLKIGRRYVSAVAVTDDFLQCQ
jgi:hypothetical protein